GAALLQEANRIRCLPNAAAPHYRDLYEALDARHDAPVWPTDIRLRDTTGMNIDSGCSRGLGAAGNFARRFPASVRTGADFQGHRNGNGLHDRGHNSLNDRRIGEQRPTFAAI